MVNKNYRVDLVLIRVDDQKALTQVQSQINQWITKGELKRFTTELSVTHILFQICRLKGGE